MGQVLHGSATTTEAIRRAIQHSQASLRSLARRYGINQKTVAKWRKRSSVADLPTGPKEPKSTVLSIEEEAIDLPKNRRGPTALWRGHMFDRVCGEHGIEHRLTKPNHPWTNGQVERMNRTIKEATVKRYYYENHDQLRSHLADFVTAYNFARRLKTLKGLTPYEYICARWTKEPQRFSLNPIHQSLGSNT